MGYLLRIALPGVPPFSSCPDPFPSIPFVSVVNLPANILPPSVGNGQFEGTRFALKSLKR